MSSQIKKTAKHSAIYAIGTILRRITALVMLPIYTRYLTPEDYGAIELLTMALEIAGILVGLRISQVMFRYYILAEDLQEKKTVVSTVLFTVLLSSAVGVAIMLAAAEPITRFIFGNLDYLFEYQLFIFTLVTNAIAAVGLAYLRARQMPVLFVAIGAATLAMQVALNIYFVVILEMHVTGVVYSSLISGSIVALGLSVYMLSQVGVGYSLSLTRKLVSYVAPLMLASIGAFYVAYADKYFLRLFSGLADVGLYALAARVTSVLAMVYEAFNLSWGADRFEVVKKPDAQAVFDQVFRFLGAVILLTGTGISLFAADFFHLMTHPSFYQAASIVPLLALAGIVRIYVIFCNFGALYRDATMIMAQAAWIKVVVASIGYLALIPLLGVYGAALVLFLATLVELVWVYRKSTALYDMGLRWWPVMQMLLFSMLVVAAGMLMPEGEWLYFALRCVLFALLLLSIYLLPFWQAEDRQIMKMAMARLRSRVPYRQS